MSEFDPNANPEGIAARAAELALEQLDRLRRVQKNNPDDPNAAGIAFFKHHFEIGISNEIAQLMAAYAVLKGYVTLERANGLE